MKNAEVEKIRHWSALVGQLGRSKNSCGHLKLILCCSLPHVIPHIKFHLNRMKNTEVPIFEFWDPQIFFWKLRWSQTIKARTFCMVSLDPELSKLFLVLMSTRHSSGSQNGPTFPNCRKRKLETSFLQHESKIEDSLRFFPDKGPCAPLLAVYYYVSWEGLKRSWKSLGAARGRRGTNGYMCTTQTDRQTERDFRPV